jgi:hypothetical protein
MAWEEGARGGLGVVVPGRRGQRMKKRPGWAMWAERLNRPAVAGPTGPEFEGKFFSE